MKSASETSSRLSKYFFMASLAEGERKTTRTFSPFPRTENSSFFRSTESRSSEANSETRRPVENKSSSMVRSRRDFMPSPSGDLNKRSNSSTEIKSRSRSGALANKILSGDKLPMPRHARYFKKFLNAIK